MKRKSVLLLAALLPVQILGLKLLPHRSLLVEEYYSNLIYPFISSIMRSSLGLLPFSLGDLLYAAFVISLLIWIWRRFSSRFRSPKIWIPDGLATLSLIYFCFHLFWGFNYYRLPLHKTLEIENEYTTEKLISLTERLIAGSNEIHRSLAENDSVKIEYNYSKKELFDLTIVGYDNIKKDYPELTYEGTALKRSLYSIPLSYMGFNGYLNPLTNEAQVNTVTVPFKLPTTASHEIGHQLGFAMENEANFIACLVTMNHPNTHFRYSGYTFALSYCLSELFRRDKEKGEELLKTINPGILKNYREVEDFWKAHQNPLEPLFAATYNSYLIANNQADGMKSYSYVVALLVNYFDKQGNIL
ncbi:DUF3810 domain-containing protein [Christiangramia aquimixticola]|uniref:DUF3810 domain-containing protein n=1 Tax=Christiangramia aquimixticola TaxID=1697558 RepID=UPI003AA99349